MPADLLQHAVVTIVALCAVWIIVRRVTGLFRREGTHTRCASCASATVTPQPLPLHRRRPSAAASDQRR